jgi:hypothetical protein
VVNGFVIVFQGRIGTHSGLNFVLATGATHSIVNRKLAHSMRVPLLSAQVFGFDRYVLLESGVFPDVQFGPINVTDVSMGRRFRPLAGFRERRGCDHRIGLSQFE